MYNGIRGENLIMPPPPELAEWVNLFVWGSALFILILMAVILGEHIARWLKVSPVQSQASLNFTGSEILKELQQDIRALREEIRELRRELRE